MFFVGFCGVSRALGRFLSALPAAASMDAAGAREGGDPLDLKLNELEALRVTPFSKLSHQEKLEVKRLAPPRPALKIDQVIHRGGAGKHSTKGKASEQKQPKKKKVQPELVQTNLTAFLAGLKEKDQSSSESAAESESESTSKSKEKDLSSKTKEKDQSKEKVDEQQQTQATSKFIRHVSPTLYKKADWICGCPVKNTFLLPLCSVLYGFCARFGLGRSRWGKRSG